MQVQVWQLPTALVFVQVSVSAGTSVFAMVVLEDQLKAVYPEIDMVTTPVGSPVAMVHANNCTSEINAG